MTISNEAVEAAIDALYPKEAKPDVTFWIDDDLLHEPDARVWAMQAGVHWIAPHGLHGITPENIISMRRTLADHAPPAGVERADDGRGGDG